MANDNAVIQLAASLTQIAPFAKRMVDGLRFLVDQPVTREPYILATSAAGGQVIAAGAVNAVLLSTDFSHSLEWPFEVKRIRFSIDAQHTFRDLSVMVQDQTFNHPWMKNPVLVDNLVAANTGFWDLDFPWIVRPQGGGQQWYVNNLDAINPIQVSISLIGALLIPRS